MQELTYVQKEFFKDSQMRLQNGNLQVFYHATKNDFDTFSKNFFSYGHGTSYGEGFYFASEPIPAYGNNLAVYLDVKKPYVLDIKDEDSLKDFAKTCGIKQEELHAWIQCYDGDVKGGIGKALREAGQEDLHSLKNKGFDGMIILNTSVGMYGQPQQEVDKEVLVFEPNQIKSIDNLFPTKSHNFKDNSEEYLKENNNKLSVQEQNEIYEYIKVRNSKYEYNTSNRLLSVDERINNAQNVSIGTDKNRSPLKTKNIDTVR